MIQDDSYRTVRPANGVDAAKIAKLQALVDEGVASGVSGRSMGEILGIARRRAKAGGK